MVHENPRVALSDTPSATVGSTNGAEAECEVTGVNCHRLAFSGSEKGMGR